MKTKDGNGDEEKKITYIGGYEDSMIGREISAKAKRRKENKSEESEEESQE